MKHTRTKAGVLSKRGYFAMQLFYPHAPSSGPRTPIVSPQNAPLKYLRVEWLRLAPGEAPVEIATGPDELALDILSGRCTARLSGACGPHAYEQIGGRRSVFDGPPTMLYVPRDSTLQISAASEGFEALLMFAPARSAHPARLIGPEECILKTVGKDNWQRQVATSIGENMAADRLIIGETLNPPGNWSSAPPHKHDSYENGEVPMEEVYIFRLDPPQGFGFQRVYAYGPNAFDCAFAVQDGDTVVLPRGYHPVVAGPGYRLAYIWALAGEARRYGAWSDDPKHAWIKD
jgi:5-deoxy-glucuronate isomerase